MRLPENLVPTVVKMVDFGYQPPSVIPEDAVSDAELAQLCTAAPPWSLMKQHRTGPSSTPLAGTSTAQQQPAPEETTTARPDSQTMTVTRSVSMTQYRQAADKTLQAMCLVEEACLTTLLEHMAQTGDESGMSTQEIAERVGLVRWLGPGVSDAVVGKVLCRLAMSDRTKPIPETLASTKWKIADVEAAIRPMPVIDVTAQSGLGVRQGQVHHSDE